MWVVQVLVCIFLVSVVLRAPWRGHLAQGDQWVTALALRSCSMRSPNRSGWSRTSSSSIG
jgi:hypothetical protein